VKEMNEYQVDICDLQERRWPGKGNAIKKNYILYSGYKRDKHEFQTGFYIGRYIKDNVLDLEPVNERICKIMVKLKYYNLTYISTHASTEEKDEVVKEEFYICLERVCDAVPNMGINTRKLQR